MIRVSEAVLPGHPDKLCDFVAESLVQAALAVDGEAYAQIEAAIWCDQLWLSGGYAARGAALDVERIAVEALDSIARAVNPACKARPVAGDERRLPVRVWTRRSGRATSTTRRS